MKLTRRITRNYQQARLASEVMRKKDKNNGLIERIEIKLNFKMSLVNIYLRTLKKLARRWPH